MPSSQAQQRLRDNWINIALTIISITQGFVFGFLLSQAPNIFIARYSPIVLVLFLLCLVLSLRVFQSVIAGVLDDDSPMPNFYEFYFVFVFGSVEYYLFSLFGKIQENHVNDFLISFYIGGMALSFLAAIGYYAALLRFVRSFKWRRKKRDEHYYSERWLQRRNILGAITIMAIQFFLFLSSSGIFAFTQSGNRQILFVVVMIAILVINTNYSMKATFGENNQMSKSATQLDTLKREKLEVTIVPAKKEDVTELRNLLIKHFNYVYKVLFGSGKKNEIPISIMLESILKAHGGKHALGYESFLIAHPKGRRREIVGMLMLKSSAERWRRLMTAWCISVIVFLNLGVRGLLRVWRNWRAIRSISQKVAANELHIVYIAVNDNVQKRHVGKQLIERARQIAKDQDKKLITLCVRANNPKAKDFFLHQDFIIENHPDDKADSKADDLLGQGAIIRMTAKVEKPQETSNER